MKKVKLIDVCDIKYGYAFDSALFNSDEKGMPLIRIRDVLRGFTETYTTENYSKDYIIEKDDLLIGMDGEFNISKWNSVNALLNQRVCKVIPKNNSYKNYVYYCLINILKAIERRTAFVTVKHLSSKELNKIEIPLPSLGEQKEIADRLDKVSSLIEKRKTQLAKLDELVKSRFIEMFGDPETNPKGLEKVLLSDIAEYFNGLTYSPDNVTNEGTIVFRSSNIQNSQLDFADTIRVNCFIKEKLFVKDNDILMCSRNGSARLVGKVALIKNLSEPMTFGAFMMIIRSKYYPYLMTYFQMDAFRRQISTGATTTINQITGNMLNKISLPLPKIADINEFAVFVEQVDKSKLAIQKSIDKLETLKKSLMQQYFG